MKKKCIVLLTLLLILFTACNPTSRVNELLQEMEEEGVDSYDALSGLDLLKYEDLNFVVEYNNGNEIVKRPYLINKIVATAIRLHLEFSILNNEDADKELEVQFSPTNKTLKIIERWEKEHQKNPEIPYPTTAIEQENWMEVGEQLKQIELEFGSEIVDIIVDGM